MSTEIEARIAEVQNAHRSRIEYKVTGERFGTIICNCGNRYGLDETYRQHVNERIAHMLAPVIREAQEQAFDEGVDEADSMTGDSLSDAVIDTAKMNNPYRSTT